MEQITLQDGTQLDPKVVKVMRAIRKIESNDNYSAIGDNGASAGGYQWNNGKTPIPEGGVPINFQNQAKTYGLDPSDFSPANQNKVAYAHIKALKDQGRQPEEIAAIWNGAHEEGGKMVYNAPEYGNKFRAALSGAPGADYNPKPFSRPGYTSQSIAPQIPISQNQPIVQNVQESELGKQLIKRTGDIGTAVKETMSGKINPVSGVIQTLGGVAGAGGDIVNAAIENIPVVGDIYKGINKFIGLGAEKFFGTPAGQSVAKSLNDFSTKHPELSRDIGAGINIATAIPILKGLGAVADIGMNATAKTLKGASEKAVYTSLENVAKKGSFKTATKVLEKNPTLFKDMVQNKVLPDIENGKYVIDEAKQGTWDNINGLETQIKSHIENKSGIANPQKIIDTTVAKMPNSGLTGFELIDNAKSLDPLNRNLWDKFTAGQANLSEANELRSALGRSIGSKMWDTPDVAAKKEIGKNLYGSMSDYIKSNVPETSDLFKQVSQQFKFQDALELINGKPVATPGLVGNALTKASGFAGQNIQNATKKAVGGLPLDLLKRSEKPIVNPLTKGKIGGLLGAAMAQKANQNK